MELIMRSNVEDILGEELLDIYVLSKNAKSKEEKQAYARMAKLVLNQNKKESINFSDMLKEATNFRLSLLNKKESN